MSAVGFRAWKVTRDEAGRPRLAALFVDAPAWDIGTSTARCLGNGKGRRHVAAPAHNCRCGLHAMTKLADLASVASRSVHMYLQVVGAVAVHGRVLVHGARGLHGVRAQHASVIALAVPDLACAEETALIEEVAAVYGVPVCRMDQLEAVAAEHGSPLRMPWRPIDILEPPLVLREVHRVMAASRVLPSILAWRRGTGRRLERGTSIVGLAESLATALGIDPAEIPRSARGALRWTLTVRPPEEAPPAPVPAPAAAPVTLDGVPVLLDDEEAEAYALDVGAVSDRLLAEVLAAAPREMAFDSVSARRLLLVAGSRRSVSLVRAFLAGNPELPDPEVVDALLCDPEGFPTEALAQLIVAAGSETPQSAMRELIRRRDLDLQGSGDGAQVQAVRICGEWLAGCRETIVRFRDGRTHPVAVRCGLLRLVPGPGDRDWALRRLRRTTDPAVAKALQPLVTLNAFDEVLVQRMRANHREAMLWWRVYGWRAPLKTIEGYLRAGLTDPAERWAWHLFAARGSAGEDLPAALVQAIIDHPAFADRVCPTLWDAGRLFPGVDLARAAARHWDRIEHPGNVWRAARALCAMSGEWAPIAARTALLAATPDSTDEAAWTRARAAIAALGAGEEDLQRWAHRTILDPRPPLPARLAALRALPADDFIVRHVLARETEPSVLRLEAKRPRREHEETWRIGSAL